MKRIVKLFLLIACMIAACFQPAYAKYHEAEIRRVLTDFRLYDQDLSPVNTLYENGKRTYIFQNHLKVEMNESGELLSLFQINEMVNNSNYPQKAVMHLEDFDNVINDLYQKKYIPSEYTARYNHLYGDDIWIIVFEREYQNNLENSYDSIKMGFDAVTGMILFYKRITDFCDVTSPKLTSDEANQILNRLIENLRIKDKFQNDPKLAIKRLFDHDGNFTENYQLEYIFKSDSGNTEIWVNAIDGSVDAVETAESYDSNSFYLYDTNTTNNNYRMTRAINYQTILGNLGYLSSITYLPSSSSSRQTMLDYIGGYNSWGFTFSGHGSPTEIGTYYNTVRIYPYDITGIWSFVVLDACNTGTNTWANSFGIYDYNNYGRSFIGWSESVTPVKANTFSWYFRSAMASNTSSSVYANVYTAIANIPGNDVYYVTYIGDRTTNGHK